MLMSLADLLRDGRFQEHRATAAEIRRLLAAADRDLKDASLKGLSADRSLATAYSAALLAVTAALAAGGYRAVSEGHHYWTIQSLSFTLRKSAGEIKKLDNYRRKRNIGDYEMSGAATEKEAAEMLVLAKALRREVATWLKSNHPDLLK